MKHVSKVNRQIGWQLKEDVWIEEWNGGNEMNEDQKESDWINRINWWARRKKDEHEKWKKSHTDRAELESGNEAGDRVDGRWWM